MHPAADINDRVMQEVNHRVKNNLQIVSSLLDLQLEFAGEKSTVDIIQTVKQRIQSMAILHDQLCNSASEGTIEISQYLKSVMNQTCVSFLDDITVKAKVSVEQCWISQQKLLLLGLVVNELLMNALAFGRNEKNEALLYLEGFVIGKNYSLKLSDKGNGFVDSTELRKGKLGLRLVDGLVKQLRGKIEQRNENGVLWKLQIPIEHAVACQ